ncbi:MAG: hypothetical protein JST42_30860 [Bacteroidetes bacterium]|nr:hypothetical protein [Bacteroidota bacterium]
MYLLLRNNKQTGPYSLEELKTMGLKAYDLVWIEGKSAAWRYPCEIDELSAYAPAVEEQPFDRFYKKPSSPVKANANSSAIVTDPLTSIPETVGTVSISEPVRSISEPAKSIPEPVTPASPAPVCSGERPIYSGEAATIPGKRIIYVTMPAGKAPVAAPARETRETPAREYRELPATPVVTREPAPAANPAPYQSVAPSTAPVYFPEKEYGHSSSRQTPIEEFLPRRQRRSQGLVRPLIISLTVLSVLAAGIFIGLSINKGSLGFEQKIASNAHSPAPANARPVKTAPPQVQPAPVVGQVAASTISDPKPVTTSATTFPPTVTEKSAPTKKPASQQSSRAQKNAAQTSGEKTASRTAVATAPALKDSAAGGLIPHREAGHRSDADDQSANTDRAAIARSAIAGQVSASANGYSVGTFGGISGLQVTVSNRSAYPLDMVVVEVQYIQSNKKIYKTENLYFRSIGAGSALMQEAPKSSRGVRVQYKITMISSKELGLSYSGI